MTTKPQSTSEPTWRSDNAHEVICDAAERIANCYCSEDDTYSLEVRRLTVAISDVVDSRVSAGVGPTVDDLENSVAFKAYNQAIEDAKNAIRAESQGGGYWAAAYINAIARRCSPHVYVNRLAAASPVEQSDDDQPQYHAKTCDRWVQCGDHEHYEPIVNCTCAAPAPSAAIQDEAEPEEAYCENCQSHHFLPLCDQPEYRSPVVAAPSSTHARAAAGGAICQSHGLAVLVTHVNDGEPCSDYLRTEPAPTTEEGAG